MNSGDIAFILICSSFVFLMTPALAFFYGGLERRKNILNTMMMVFCMLGIASLVWVIAGYSLAFSGHGLWVGDLSRMFLKGVSATEGKGIPDMLFAIFQMMFALIATAILTGSVVGRMKFSAMVSFIILWLVLVYAPMAHMVWGHGFLEKIGSIDFAGGNVIHISSGISGLVLALVIGRRKDYMKLDNTPHNVPYVVLGTALLWFGWFGFNGGSALGANGLAIHAFLTTNIAAASGMISWMIVERFFVEKPTIVGACTGSIVGLVAITPGAGFVSAASAMMIGLAVIPVCYFFIVSIKRRLKLDDTLDAFGCHGIGGIFGGLMVGIFADPSLGHAGLLYGNTHLFIAQVESIIFTIAFSAIMSFGIVMVVKRFLPLRATEEDEVIGMDLAEHNERAYVKEAGKKLFS
ncbi:ammonium transporter [Vagococcus vulneris]|uniref:Ammonium transporter n=1 Tax=Vagococcus vulneris TaxID=1977869 RepID=A0A430A0A1_9ENTE|nr:ammonium transporter [Vagococcus vulneris]RST99766.1 ammonia permease [Vagococcus vulneris]